MRRTLPDIVVLIRLSAVGVEAALGGLGLIRARCRLRDTLASIAMRFGIVASHGRRSSATSSGALGSAFGRPGWRPDGRDRVVANVRAAWRASGRVA
jgi:hypothetical protein